ncbi:MAG: peptidylprolyl isomerase [candidate division NC10 bacterium]
MRIAGVIGLTLALALTAAEAQEKDKAVSPAIENGAKVQLEYTLKDDGGKVLDSNKGRDPLTYTQGQKQIIPGLEQALSGMRAGDEKKVTVKPADAYGEVNPNAVTEVPKEMLPPDALKVGTELVAQSQGGDRRIVRIKEVREQTVVIDLNHPLAGKTLFFDVKVLGVESPKK